MRRSIRLVLAASAAALAAVALLLPGCKDAPTAVAPQNLTPVYWTPYGQALERAQRENKPLMVFFYTQWCGWSKKMDEATFGDSSVAQYLRANFVTAHIDAESAAAIGVGDDMTSGMRLASVFGVNSFPTTWFLTATGDRIDRTLGYVAAAPFLQTLVTIHEHPVP